MESLLTLRHNAVEKLWSFPLVSAASGTVGTLVGTGLDLTKTVIHGSLQLIDSGVTKATDLAKSSLQFVKRSVNTGADFAISALDTAKTKTSGTIKVVESKVDAVADGAKHKLHISPKEEEGYSVKKSE
eukprot:TRINITY_DN14848_c0_g1_i1.p1 TRINITY_DN14848_c0_g1~~TRINITY_DN14848_c0_g1_i1.p1  ORF type:complete len:129 (-),score=18.11 TRINITY_DN14848_c0_g1_i1:84-470(-)